MKHIYFFGIVILGGLAVAGFNQLNSRSNSFTIPGVVEDVDISKKSNSQAQLDNQNLKSTATEQNLRAAPDFTLNTLDGREITLSDFKDKKPVILDFWASWCPNCNRSLPKNNIYYSLYRDDIELLAINLQEDRSTVASYVNEEGFDFPVLLDPEARVSQKYGIRYTNVHVLINKKGKIVKIIPGDLQEKDFRELVEE